MAQVYPFHAYRYNASRVSFERVLTQPYDKISPAMQEKYYAADAHNLITIEKGRVSARRCATAQRLHASGGSAGELDSRQHRFARHGVVVLRVYAGVHRAGNRAAARAPRIYRRGQAGGIFRGGSVPPRTHAFGAESRPSGTAAARAHAHRATFHAVQRRAAARGCNSGRSGGGGAAGDGITRRIWRGTPALGGVATGARRGDPGSHGQAKAGDRRRAPPLRDGAELPQREARGGGTKQSDRALRKQFARIGGRCLRRRPVRAGDDDLCQHAQ